MRSQRALAAALIMLVSSSPVFGQKGNEANATAKTESKAQPAAVYYDFKGARIGMTFAEWQALKAPVADDGYVSQYEGPLRIWCSDMRGADGKPIMGTGYLSDIEKSLGVIVCRYGRLSTIGSYRNVSSAPIKIGQFASSDVEYKFVGGRLYEINITGHQNLLGEIMDGLTAKFGAPSSEVNDTTQNKAGATFPHTEKMWVNPASVIRVESPYTRIDNLNVRYIDAATLKRLNEAEEVMNPAAEKM